MSQAGTKKGWLLIALATVVLVVAGSCVRKSETGGNSDASNGAGGQPSSKEDISPQFARDAGSMLLEFKDDESNSETKYKDKWIELTGVVNEADSTLKLGDGTFAETATVNCHDIPDEGLSGVSKGDNVTVIGKFKESGDEGLEFERCRLLQNAGPS